MRSEEARASELSFTHHCRPVAEKVKGEMLKGGSTFRPERWDRSHGKIMFQEGTKVLCPADRMQTKG